MRARVTRTCCPMHISLPLFLSEIFLPGHEILGVASKASYCFQLWIWPQGGVVVKFGTESNNFRAKMMIGEPRPFTLFTPIYVAFLLRSVALMIWGHLYDSESLYALLCSKFLLSKKIFFFKRKCIPISFQNSQQPSPLLVFCQSMYLDETEVEFYCSQW